MIVKAWEIKSMKIVECFINFEVNFMLQKLVEPFFSYSLWMVINFKVVNSDEKKLLKAHQKKQKLYK